MWSLRAFDPLPSSVAMSKLRFGRSNPERTRTGSRSPILREISSATSSVAVAVQAITVGRPRRRAAVAPGAPRVAQDVAGRAGPQHRGGVAAAREPLPLVRHERDQRAD